jgi:antitoxin YefM
VTIMPFTEAHNRLSDVLDEVERTHDRIEITRHGHAVAVLISPNDLAVLEETIEVLSSPEAMRQLAESGSAIEIGGVLDGEDLAKLMSHRHRRQRGAHRRGTVIDK